MKDCGGFTPVKDLLSRPELKEARQIEVGLWDAVHFRLSEPRLVFELIEEHLCQRNSGQFRGYATVREKIEREKRGASLRDKVDACCSRHPDWFPDRQVLYSSELEVWMDLSYPNPWVLELYHEALYQGKALYISRACPYSPLFIKLLLQKNGFERLSEEPVPDKKVGIVFDQMEAVRTNQVHFEIPGQNDDRHAFAGDSYLPSQLANGNIRRDMERMKLRNPTGKKQHLRELGYRLIGPTLWLMIQRLSRETEPVAFTGPGAEFLTTLMRSVHQRWSIVPEIVIEEKASVIASLFPGVKSAFSLLPMDGCRHCPNLVPINQCEPRSLFLEPLERFFLAILEGEEAAEVQAAATDFVEEFALMTRGLQLQLPVAPIIREWQLFILSPSHDFLQAILESRIVPGFDAPQNPWQAGRQIETGPWPTGSYLLTNPLDRWWIQVTKANRKKNIGEWLDRRDEDVPKVADAAG